MKIFKNMIGGLAGAVSLNLVHQIVKQIDPKAPRVDLVGEEALTKGMKGVGLTPPSGDTLFAATLAGDILSNALYYSTIGFGKRKHLIIRGAALGLAAGIGALTLTKPLGLSDAPVTRTDQTKILTVAFYTLGGIVAGSVIKMLRKK